MRSLIFCTGLLVAGCSVAMDTKAAEEQVVLFHHQLDSVQSNQIYRAASDQFHRSASEDNTRKLIEAVHRKLGATKSATLKSWRVNMTTEGKIIELRYATMFEKGTAAEDFAYREKDGKFTLNGYNINSSALLID